MIMSLSTSRKVLLGIAIVIAAVVAGTFHWWMAFALVWLGLAAFFLLIHLESRAHDAAASSCATSELTAISNAWHDHQKQMLEERKRLDDELATSPANKHLAGNSSHYIELE